MGLPHSPGRLQHIPGANVCCLATFMACCGRAHRGARLAHAGGRVAVKAHGEDVRRRTHV